MKKNVIGIGNVGIDFLGVVDRLPAPGSAVEMSQFSIQGSGRVATELVTANVMGLETRICGKIADDMFGQFIESSLGQIGIGIDGLVMEKGRVSPFSYVAVESSSKHDVVFSTPGNCSPLAPEELDLSVLDGASALLLDGYQMRASIHAAEYASKNGVPVVLDAASVIEGTGELLSLTNVLLASERFASEIAPMGELEDALFELSRMGPEVVVITLGSEGSIGLEGKKVFRQEAHKVDIVDTTGAGDIYRGAFLYGWIEGWPMEKSMRFASVAAGLSCRNLGGLAGIPELSQVLEVIG